MRKALLVLCAAFLFEGCIAVVKDSSDNKGYSSYVTETQRLNLEREKAGLAPVKVLTYKEWHGGP